MSTKKMTPVFPAHIKPVRPGVYRATYCDESSMGWGWAYWGGVCWAPCQPDPQEALRRHKQGRVAVYQNKPWRGLAADPRATKGGAS